MKAVEESHLTVSTATELVRGITTIRTNLSTGRIHDAYVPLVLKGMIGLFHNRFFEIWEPVSECLAVLIKKHTGVVWNDFVHYLGQCQLKLEALDNHSENENYSISQKHTGRCFRYFSNLYLYITIFCISYSILFIYLSSLLYSSNVCLFNLQV